MYILQTVSLVHKNIGIRYLGRVYLDYFQTLNYYDGGAADNVC